MTLDIARRATVPLPLDSPEGLSAMHRATLEVLERTGVRFASARALDLFRARAFRVAGERVYFSEKQVRDALETVPPRFTILARNPARHVELGPGATVCGPGRGAIAMVEPDGSRRAGCRQDLLDVARLFQQLDALEIWGFLIHPADPEPGNTRLWMYRTMIRDTDKPYDYMHRDDIDLVALAYSTSREKMAARGDLDRSPGQATASVTSPLTFLPDECENLMEFARCGIAFHIASMPIAGATGPCTPAGTVLLQNCENLAGIVLAQLVRPGCPVFYGALGGQADMRSARPLFGTAAARLIERAGAQMAGYYGLLSRGNIGLTDAAHCDFQAGAQAMLHTLLVLQQGLNFLPGCGLLGSYREASLAKVVLDVELIRCARQASKPLRTDRESLAAAAIADVGPGGHFLTHDHTLAHHRSELPGSDIFVSAEGGDVVRAAHEKARRLIDSCQPPPLDAGLEAEIDAYIERRWRA